MLCDRGSLRPSLARLPDRRQHRAGAM